MRPIRMRPDKVGCPYYFISGAGERRSDEGGLRQKEGHRRHHRVVGGEADGARRATLSWRRAAVGEGRGDKRGGVRIPTSFVCVCPRGVRPRKRAIDELHRN